MNILMLNYEFPPIGGGAANANLCLLKEYAGNGDLRVGVCRKQLHGFCRGRLV